MPYYDKEGKVERRHEVDVTFRPSELLAETFGYEDHRLMVSGMDTSVWSLAHQGFSLRVRRKRHGSRHWKYVFSKGNNSLSLWTQKPPVDMSLSGLLNSICHCYPAKEKVDISSREAPSALYYRHGIKEHSEAELLAELERRVDLRPKKRRKRKAKAPSNVIDIKKILKRVQDFEQRNAA